MSITVYISNVSEDVWDLIQALPKTEKAAEIAENTSLADREIWANIAERRLIMVTLAPVTPEFLSYYQTLAPHQKITIISPVEKTGQTCLDLLADRQARSTLTDLCRGQKIKLISYSATTQFWQVVDFLKQAGINVTTPESPVREAAWTPNFFGSKSGVRQLAAQLQPPNRPWMSPGRICFGVHDTASLAADWYSKHQGVVIKTYKAHAGVGVLIFKPGDLPQRYADCYDRLFALLSTTPYWAEFPTIVEQLVEVDISVGGGNPNVEYQVAEDGRVTFLYGCGMRVTDQGMFQGVEIHHSVLPSRTLKQLKTMGQKLGRAYQQAGYRGYYDVDCLATKSGELLLTESNVRRTGGTHAYHLAKYLIGTHFFRRRYVLAINNLQLSTKRKISFSQLKKSLEPELFSPATQEGIVLISANLLKYGKLAYVIFGQTKDRTYHLEQIMLARLEYNSRHL